MKEEKLVEGSDAYIPVTGGRLWEEVDV